MRYSRNLVHLIWSCWEIHYHISANFPPPHNYAITVWRRHDENEEEKERSRSGINERQSVVSRVQGWAYIMVQRFGEICSCCCLPHLPQHACSILATWGPRLAKPCTVATKKHFMDILLWFDIQPTLIGMCKSRNLFLVKWSFIPQWEIRFSPSDAFHRKKLLPTSQSEEMKRRRKEGRNVGNKGGEISNTAEGGNQTKVCQIFNKWKSKTYLLFQFIN